MLEFHQFHLFFTSWSGGFCRRTFLNIRTKHWINDSLLPSFRDARNSLSFMQEGPPTKSRVFNQTRPFYSCCFFGRLIRFLSMRLVQIRVALRCFRDDPICQSVWRVFKLKQYPKRGFEWWFSRLYVWCLRETFIANHESYLGLFFSASQDAIGKGLIVKAKCLISQASMKLGGYRWKIPVKVGP